MPKLGCSTRLAVGILVVLLLLFMVGLAGGALGRSLGIPAPSFLSVSEPHIGEGEFFFRGEEVFHLFGFPITNSLLASWLAIIVLVGVCYAATRRMKVIPGRLQGMVEAGLEVLINFVEGAAGRKNGRRFLPIVGTIFLFVIVNAYLALLPFFGPSIVVGTGAPLFRSANTDINMPLAFAVMSFIFVEFWGMSSRGFFRYLGEFLNVGQLFESLKQLFKGKIRAASSGIITGVINLFMGLLEALSHLIRMVSFTFRLFGNMTAGEILLLIAVFLIPWVLAIPFYGLELLIGFIQALIFAGLTLVFAIIAVGPHGEEETHKERRVNGT